MPFDKMNDSIAITLKRFKLLKSSEGLANLANPYNEPYLVSLAVDAKGSAAPGIEFSAMPFPKVRRGQTVNFVGDGHLLYGPKNPGTFVACSVLFMESDSDVRNLGEVIERLVKNKATDLGMKVIMAAHPGAAGTLAILKELTQFVAGELKNNKDDELMRTEGTFLRDHPAPYHVNRQYTIQNDYVETDWQVIPLPQANGQGLAPRCITL